MRKNNAETKTKNADLLAAENDKFIASFATALGKHCPNDERAGCPAPEVLKTMAFGRPRMDELELWFDHFAFCGACLRDFKRWRQQATWRRRAGIGLATAAAAVLCVSLIVWKSSHQPRTARDQEDTAMISAVLDLEHGGPTRDPNGETLPTPSIPQLPCGRLALSIYLPPQNSIGQYDAQLLRSHHDASPLATFVGEAHIDHGHTILSTHVDLSKVPPGTYNFAYRHTGDEWQYFPIVLEVMRSAPK